MKIKEVNTNYILFDNGSRITFDHEQDCCETNYADFEQLEDLALEYEFENDLIFEVVPENGFRFGSKGTPMFFIPCYSDQNGYYSSDIDIFYDGRHVFNVDCEETWSWEADKFLAPSAAKCCGKKMPSLEDIAYIIQKEVKENVAND